MPDISPITTLADARAGRKAGSKAAYLSEVMAAGFPVPRGFVISADSYRSHLWASGARDLATSAVEAEQREELRSAILAARIPADVWEAATEAYKQIALQTGREEPRVAVRSSAVDEPVEDGAFEGAYETCLNVEGPDQLGAAIKRVWASLWTGKAAAFRAKCGGSGEPGMAVIVQQMLEADWSGRCFTADPVSGNPCRLIVTCSSGSGASEIKPSSSFAIDLETMNIVDRSVEDESACSDDLVYRVVETAIKIEEYMGEPVEMEWSCDRDRLSVLQAKPIRGLPAYFPGWDECDGDLWGAAASHPISEFARSLHFDSRWEQTDNQPYKLINGYVYIRAVPPKNRIEAGKRLLKQWEREIGPDIAAIYGELAKPELSKLAAPALLRHLRLAADTARNVVSLLHDCGWASAAYVKDVRDSVGDIIDDPETAARLLGGIDQPFVLRDARLQELGERFAIGESQGKLDDDSWRRAFRKMVEEFADEYGYSFTNAVGLFDAASWKSWVEDADSVFWIVAALSHGSGRQSFVTLQESAAAAREQVEESLRSRLTGKDASAIVDSFQLAGKWIRARCECEMLAGRVLTRLRLALLEIAAGMRYSGLIGEIDDVFHLRIEEILDTKQDAASLATKIAARKHRIWLEKRLCTPTGYAREHGEGLRGDALSPGNAAGRARTASTIEEAGLLEPGEILVVVEPSLAWTPFLGIAAGFVAESANPDREAFALFARTYGVPAIAGCSGILSSVRNGRRISIDADSGAVNVQ